MKKWGVSLIFIFIAFSTAVARDIKVVSTDKLYRLLAAAPYSLVLFYNRDKSAIRDETIRQNISDTEIMLRSLSRSPLYDGADLQIILADVSRGNLAQALEEYKVTTIPTFMTFIGRAPAGDQLSGFADREPLTEFIDKNLKEQINKHMQEKAAKRERDLETARIDAYNRNYWLGSPYWDSFWYGGYYPYWFGPY